MTLTTNSTLLLIENDAADSKVIQDILVGDPLDIQSAKSLSEALERLAGKNIVAILLNLFLPDSAGIETFDQIYAGAPPLPILILGNSSVESLAINALQRGAQDYLLKPRLN